MDYKQTSDNAEKTLQDFIQGMQGRNLTNIDQTRQSVMSSRSPLFQASGMGVDPMAYQEQVGLAQNKLNTGLESTLNQQKFQGAKGQLTQQLGNLNRVNTNKTNALQDTNAYLKQNLSQNIQNQYQSEALQKRLDLQRQQLDIGENYAKQGLSQEQQYGQNPDDLYQQAMYRALFGLAGSGAVLGGYAMMNRTPSTPNQPTNLDAYKGIGPQQNLGYYPERPSFLVTR